MGFRKIIFATTLGSVALFLFGGAFQAIPQFGIGAVESLETDKLTTDGFSSLADRMAYIMTDQTVSFVATKPSAYYSLTRFFLIEFLSAMGIALLFAIVFSRLGATSLRQRLLLTMGFALACVLAVHLPYLNWWGFSLPYTLGVATQTILGWLLVSYIQNRFIFKIR